MNPGEACLDFAFLVHSQASLTHGVPPRFDDGPGVRQKRRRTRYAIQACSGQRSKFHGGGGNNTYLTTLQSPDDHAILEAAYQANSKPDKAERIAIVNRVELGEKEVQIWFQNRRQNDRRKSRPLLPHELVPHFRNPVPDELLSGRVADSPDGRRTAVNADESSACPKIQDLEHSLSRCSNIQNLLNPQCHVETRTPFSDEQPSVYKSNSGTSISSNSGLGEDSSVKIKGESRVLSASRDVLDRPPSRGVKRSHEKIAGASPDVASTLPAPGCLVTTQGPSVRLSMSLDGAVEVKTNDEDTPSPPKQRLNPVVSAAKASRPLQRSKSAVLSADLSSQARAGAQNSRRSIGLFGRSRDVRTWEFYCDNDARDALSSHAECERRGSAVSAIALIRSQSLKTKTIIMGEKTIGSNNPASEASPIHQKPKLSRAKSTMARPQDFAGLPSSKQHRLSLINSPSGDSDKENWAPGTRSSNSQLRRQPGVSNGRPVLQDHPQPLSRANSFAAASTQGRIASKTPKCDTAEKKNGHKQHRNNVDMEDDEHGEDLDCIQGLLSLSQGAWR